MGTQVRNIGWNSGNSPYMQKTTALLSDGTRVVCICDANQAGVSGDGGDGTGVAKAYFYTSSNGTTWTLRATISLTQYSNHVRGSMSIGANNNIHFAYVNTSGAITYYLLTYAAGPTYTVGSAETALAAPGAGFQYYRCDIDVAGTGNNAMVAAYLEKSTTTTFHRLMVSVRNNTPAWATVVQQDLITSATNFSYADEITISCDQTAIAADNLTTAAIWVVRKASTGTDFGDALWMVRVNVSTNAVTTSNPVTNVNTNIGSGYRKSKLINVGTDTWILASSVNYSPFRMMVGKFTWNRSTSVYTQQVAWTSINQGYADRTQDQIGWTDQAYVGNNKIIFTRRDNTLRVVTVATINADNSITWSNTGYVEDKYYYPGGIQSSQLWMGTPRNYSASVIPYISTYISQPGVNAYSVQWWEKYNPLTGAVLAPGSGTTIISSQPTLRATHKWAVNNAPFRTKLQFQLATDSGFTTNLRTVTEPDADQIFANNTVGSSSIFSDEVVPSLSALFTSTWFVRARAVDETGSFGPYSSSISFSVSHPPVGANLYPTANQVFVYGQGAITFSWDFTDPFLGDYQSAYQVIVSNADTGAVVVDTGKVMSSSHSASPTIPVSAKDTNLQWTLTLWDSDNAAGPISTPQLFWITDSPTPTITSPTANQVLTAANPTITWTPGIGASKTQTQYRVYISSAGNIIYDSGYINTADTSYKIPTGYLTNNGSYTVNVYVRDNYNLTSTASQIFTTSWTPPTARSLSSVYLATYARFGYVHLVLDPTGFDVDFLGWNIYRRKYGDTAWTLLTTLTKTSDLVTYRDYTAASGTKYQYAMTQMADRFGDYVESSLSASTVFTVTPQADTYWLINEITPSDSMPIYQVTADTFEDEYEEATYNVIGKGRHRDYGDRLGYSGTLTCQLRPRVMGGIERYNWIINPSLAYADPGPTPNGWILSSTGTVGTLTESFVNTQDPSPANVSNVYSVNASGLGTATTDAVTISQVVILDPTVNVGDTCTWSIWVNTVQGDISGRRLEIGMRWETSGAALVRDDFAESPGIIETFTSSVFGQPDYLSTANAVTGQWKRYAISGTRPATATQVRVRIQLEGIASGSVGSKTLLVTGGQFEEYPTATEYFDGRRLGQTWLGQRDLSASYSTGYFTARTQRMVLEAFKSNKVSALLRTPFGDLFSVAAGNLGFTRIAGTGPMELDDVTIPYVEVSRQSSGGANVTALTPYVVVSGTTTQAGNVDGGSASSVFSVGYDGGSA